MEKLNGFTVSKNGKNWNALNKKRGKEHYVVNTHCLFVRLVVPK